VKELVYHRSLLPAASQFADKVISIDGDHRATFGEHLDRVLRLGHAMRNQLGVQPGDRFAVMALNGHHFLELYHAGFLGAGVINPLNLRLAPMELEFILGDSGSKVCFADAFFAPLIDRVRKAAGVERLVYLHQTPMFHAASFGGVLTIPAIGATTTYVNLFEPTAVLDVVEREQVTTTVMVPTMIQMLLDHPAYRPERLRSLRSLVYGASPMPTALLERLLGELPAVDVYQGYGTTESCGLLTVLGPEEHRQGGELLRSAGRPIIGTSLTIQDSTGQVLGPGEIGEVCVRCGNLMREYWHRPAETAAAFAGGWYHTGDAGRLDDDGYLYLIDRVKDMIVSGGENVYSAEVENALSSHPAVAQVAVIGIPSERWGEAVHAVVVLKPGQEVSEHDLQEWARERIAGYKIPKSIEFRAEPLPLSGAMKILKRELRAPYWEGKDRSVQ